MALMDADCEVSRLYEMANFNEMTPPSMISLAFRLLGTDSVVRVRGLGPLAVYSPEDQRILIRASAPMGAVVHCIGHEIAEWHLAMSGYNGSDHETLSDAIGVRLQAPRCAVRMAARETDGSILAIARWFRISETVSALRHGEALDTPIAVVTPGWIRIRGEERQWPDERHLRLIAGGKMEAPVTRVALTDHPRRVALIAA